MSLTKHTYSHELYFKKLSMIRVIGYLNLNKSEYSYSYEICIYIKKKENNEKIYF